jgi:hypothetical protein
LFDILWQNLMPNISSVSLVRPFRVDIYRGDPRDLILQENKMYDVHHIVKHTGKAKVYQDRKKLKFLVAW